MQNQNQVIPKRPNRIQKKTCPLCKHVLPLFDEQGNHNFVPALSADGEVKSICVSCKMKEIQKFWAM